MGGLTKRIGSVTFCSVNLRSDFLFSFCAVSLLSGILVFMRLSASLNEP